MLKNEDLAFVTKYVYDRLVGSIDSSDLPIKWNKSLFEEKVYDKFSLYYWFNTPERNKLFLYRSILENNERLQAYNVLKEYKDTYQFVFMTGGKLKYHINPTCQAFKDKYYLYLVPPEIKDEKLELINTYRGWFKTRRFKEKLELGEIENKDILGLYNEVFCKTHNLKKLSSFKFYEETKSSGIQVVEDSFVLSDFENKLKELSYKRFDFCQHNKTMLAVSKLDFLKDKSEDEVIIKFKEYSQNTDAFQANFPINYGLDKLRDFWNGHYFLKKETEDLLKDYFRWNYNFFDSSFDVLQLENFGLECCRFCKKKK